MSKEELLKLLQEYGDTQFICGEWGYDSNESWDAVYRRAQRARKRLYRYLGLMK